MKTPTLKEINELVTFARDSNGTLGVFDVKGDVWENVEGDVYGNVYGDVYGNVEGGVYCNFEGGVDRAIKSNQTEIQTTTTEIQTTIKNNNTMKIKKKKLLKYLNEKVALFRKEAETAANDGDYELAHEQAVISRFLMYYLIDSIDEDFPEKEEKR